MRHIKAGICILLFISTTFIGCQEEDNNGEIHELDKKYLSESQLFALNRAIDEDPDEAENYYKRAKVYLEKDQESKALKDIERAIALSNAEGRFYLLQARILDQSHQLAAALQAAKTAENLRANQAEVKMLLSKLNLKMNQKEAARQYLNQASMLTPHHSDIYFLKGKLAAMESDTMNAIAAFFIALEKDTNNIEVYKELSGIYFNRHKYDSAMMFVATGRSVEPEDPFFYYMEGRFMEHVNLKEAAKVSYLNSLKFDSAFYEAYKALGIMYLKEENHSKAAGYFEKELTYDSNSIQSALYLSELYEKQGKGQLAVPLLERVLKVDSVNSKARQALEKLYVVYPKKIEAEVKKEERKDSVINPAPSPKPKPDSARKAPVVKPPVKADTVLKKPSVRPVLPDTSGKTKAAGKNNSKKAADSTKEIRNFVPKITNPDSANAGVKKDTVK